MLCFRSYKIWGTTWIQAVVLTASTAALVSCAQTQLAVHTAKQLLPAPTAEGQYKVGKPYQVNGIWYTPAEDPFYDESGIASWYGYPFHGRRTANGEIYDMNALTAAHKTLPMPSYVRVTNLENGRSLILKVNDRGPFVDGRIIDVSRRAAQLLGFQEKGIARTRVEVVPGPGNIRVGEAKATADAHQQQVAIDAMATADTETLLISPLSFLENIFAERAALADVPATNIYVQAGAFTQIEAANALRLELQSFGNVAVSTIQVGEREFFRVRVGPLETVPRADATLAMIMAKGYAGAHIVVD